MCTVVVRVDPGSEWPVTMLALRDESPTRPWDPPAAWWPERDPSLRGVRDRQAGGAWLAGADAAGIAVVLNRGEDVLSGNGTWTTRGMLPLNALQGSMPTGNGSLPTTRAFNLVRATSSGAAVVSWDGSCVRTTVLQPGVHMITHGDADDLSVPRVGRWLESFRAVAAPDAPPSIVPPDELRVGGGSLDFGEVWRPWFGVLIESAHLDVNDPEAILRDTVEPEGRFATLSIVAAAVGWGRTVLQHARLANPGNIREAAELHHS